MNQGSIYNNILRIAHDLEHKRSGIDLITGVEIGKKTSFGRPNWKGIVGRVASDHKHERIGVFFCGNHQLGSQLEETIAHVRKEQNHGRIVFCKENFEV